MTRQVLVVEDQQDMRNLVALHLRDMGCQITLAQNGADGLMHAKNHHYDLMVLDWMLPGISGVDICREMRSCGNQSPILMLTGNCMESERITGLDAGADDYVTKPFSVPELLARVRSIFRRNEALQQTDEYDSRHDVLCMKELTIDVAKRLIHLRAKPLDLTAKEFDLLWHLAHHPGQVFTRQQLLDVVWGKGFDGYEHTVNSHINRLRAKIEKDPSNPEYIVTAWGIGYKMPDYRYH